MVCVIFNPSFLSNSNARAPVTCGQAMLVPRSARCLPSGVVCDVGKEAWVERAETITSPGAVMFGFIPVAVGSGVGPLLEKNDRLPMGGS